MDMAGRRWAPLLLLLALASQCHASAAATSAIAATAPAPPQPVFKAHVNWVALAGILVGGWAIVMLCVAVSFRVCRRRSSPLTTQILEEGTTTSDAQRQQTGGAPTQTFRTVQGRGKSAMMMQSEQPQFDLGAMERQIKMGFVRKVYSILATQLLLTVLVVVGCIYAAFEMGDGGPDPSVRTAFGTWMINWGGLVILVSLIPIIGLICALTSLKNRYPHNYILLLLFTLFESATLGLTCVFYYAAGFGDQILLAAALTLSIFLVLTLYTMQSKIDWSFLGPSIFACLFVLMFWSLFQYVFIGAASFVAYQLISLFGAIIFCLFIIYDTNNIMKHFGVDDYIIASVELYLDVINLFRYLLMLLAFSSRN